MKGVRSRRAGRLRRPASWPAVAVVLLALPGGAPAPAAPGAVLSAGTFRSATAVIIVDGTTAVPYPSTIEVTGLAGPLTGILVGFREFEHVSPRDTDALLVSPSGATAIVMSDACGLPNMINVNLVFDDGAAGPLPADPAVACTAGGYQLSDWPLGPADSFPAPAPAGPWGAALAGFLGVSPNGTWSLYVVDDLALGEPPGRIEWWTLTLTTDPGPLFLDDFETGNLVRWSSAVP